MKKLAYIFTAVLAFGTLVSSCDGMLDEKNYGNQTISDMMSDEDNVVLLVGQIYADLKYTHDTGAIGVYRPLLPMKVSAYHAMADKTGTMVAIG